MFVVVVVGTHVLGVVPSFYSCRLSHGVLVRFLRFRLGCHHLRIHTGRWLPPLLPHSQRTCLRCSSTVVDDEAHCLFMCEHPTIVEARDLFLAAVVPPVAALSSLRYADFWALSATGCVPLSALVKYVAVCVRVCWYCHQTNKNLRCGISPVVLMWWTYRISCSRQVNIWICLIRSRRQMFLVIRLMRNWLKSR